MNWIELVPAHVKKWIEFELIQELIQIQFNFVQFWIEFSVRMFKKIHFTRNSIQNWTKLIWISELIHPAASNWIEFELIQAAKKIRNVGQKLNYDLIFLSKIELNLELFQIRELIHELYIPGSQYG